VIGDDDDDDDNTFPFIQIWNEREREQRDFHVFVCMYACLYVCMFVCLLCLFICMYCISIFPNPHLNSACFTFSKPPREVLLRLSEIRMDKDG